MLGRPFERLHDVVEMPLRIGLRHGIPAEFLAENDLAIDERGRLPVTGPEIEPDAAAFQMASQRSGVGPGGGNILCHDYFKRMPVNALSHDVRVEFTRGGFAKILLQLAAQGGGPVEVHPVSSARPEQEFNQSFHAKKVRGRPRRIVREEGRIEMENGTVGLFEREPGRDGMAGGGGPGRKSAMGESRGTESRIKGWLYLRNLLHECIILHGGNAKC